MKQIADTIVAENTPLVVENLKVDSFDGAKAEAFAGNLAGMLNTAAASLMISVGHRTGLFDAMAELPFSTSQEIAAAAKLSERYVREWLGAMTTAGIVEYRADDNTYRLPAEHAAFLTRAAVPNNFAVVFQFLAVLGEAEDKVVAAFKHGRGVPYSAYPRFHEVMAEESGQSVVAVLIDHIIPLEPGLRERLEQGIDVADVGCGSGRALILLASHFPNSRFSGFDFSEETIAAARAEVSRRGLTNIEFLVQDAAQLIQPNSYDLVMTFDAIHDQAHPDAVLANINTMLRPGGTYLMQDIAASSHVHLNKEHPLSAFIYTISCMHCMSVSLASGGIGLGAAWGKELALIMLNEAGFGDTRVEQLPHDIANYYYISHKA